MPGYSWLPHSSAMAAVALQAALQRRKAQAVTKPVVMQSPLQPSIELLMELSASDAELQGLLQAGGPGFVVDSHGDVCNAFCYILCMLEWIAVLRTSRRCGRSSGLSLRRTFP